MRTRLRYYIVKHNSSHFDISEKMSSCHYDEERGSGFDVMESFRQNLVAKFIERKNVSEETLLPDGTVEVIKRVIYSIFEFELFELKSGVSVVRILNSPPSLKKFVDSIADFFEEFSISKVAFDPYEIYEYTISNGDVSRHEVPRIIASQIPYSSKAIAVVDLRSTANALKALESKHADNSFRLDKLFMILRYKGDSCSLEVSATGVIACSFSLIPVMDSFVIEQFEPNKRIRS